MKKIMSLLLVGVMVCCMKPGAYAAETYNSPDANTEMGTDVAVTGTRTTLDENGDPVHNVEYTVTVPAKLIPGVGQTASGTVTLEGYWPSNATVTVSAEDKVEVVNSISGGDKKELAITFADIVKAGDNDGVVTASETVTVAGIDAALFGTWEGVFNYNVEYADGTTTDGDSGTTVDPDTGDDGEQANIATFTIDYKGTVDTYTAPSDIQWCNMEDMGYELPAGLSTSSSYLRKIVTGTFYYLYLDGVKVSSFDTPQNGAAYELLADE